MHLANAQGETLLHLPIHRDLQSTPQCQLVLTRRSRCGVLTHVAGPDVQENHGSFRDDLSVIEEILRSTAGQRESGYGIKPGSRHEYRALPSRGAMPNLPQDLLDESHEICAALVVGGITKRVVDRVVFADSHQCLLLNILSLRQKTNAPRHSRVHGVQTGC